MSGVILNRFEESRIPNEKLPAGWRDQAALDELAEFLQSNWEQRAVFFDDGEITSRQQYLSFTGSGGIRTGNYVGTIVFRGQRLNIFPKVFRRDRDDAETDGLEPGHLMKNLVQWLHYCGRTSYPFISITCEPEDGSDLKELFITLYLRYVKSALEHGPFYRYEDRQKDLGVIRGRLDFPDYVSRKLPKGSSNRFRCSFSEFEFDNAVNRIIKYTCKGLAGETTSAENRKIIRNIQIRLNEVSDVRCAPADCDGIRLSRLHRRYAVILSMSRMLLMNQTASYNVGEQNSFCFLFPSELLFEGFIGGFMAETLRGEARVRLQASELTLISDVVFDGRHLGQAFTMRHDILVEHREQGLFVLDTKYKHMSRFEGNSDVKRSVTDEVSQSDLYQVIEYAAHRDIDSAYLLYPMYRFEAEEPNDVILERRSVSGKTISVHIVRLPFVFEEDEDALKRSLTKAIRRIFAQG